MKNMQMKSILHYSLFLQILVGTTISNFTSFGNIIGPPVDNNWIEYPSPNGLVCGDVIRMTKSVIHTYDKNLLVVREIEVYASEY